LPNCRPAKAFRVSRFPRRSFSRHPPLARRPSARQRETEIFRLPFVSSARSASPCRAEESTATSKGSFVPREREPRASPRPSLSGASSSSPALFTRPLSHAVSSLHLASPDFDSFLKRKRREGGRRLRRKPRARLSSGAIPFGSCQFRAKPASKRGCAKVGDVPLRRSETPTCVRDGGGKRA